MLDGDRLASGNMDRSIIIWNLADGKRLRKLEGRRVSADYELELAIGTNSRAGADIRSPLPPIA